MYKIIILIILLFTTTEISAVSCKYGRGACIASCMVQNCATGYCPNGSDGICTVQDVILVHQFHSDRLIIFN